MMFSQFIKYIGVGAINTIITYLLYLILLYILNYQISYTIAYLFGIGLSYWLNLKVVFKENSSKKKIVLFPLVYLVQYTLGMFILYAAIDKFNLPEEIAPILVVFITIPLTFFLTRKVLANNDLLSRRKSSVMVLLSQKLSPKLGFYKGKTREIRSEVIDVIDKFNRETKLNIDSHTGTHIDYPAHAIKDGVFGDEYPIDYLCSDKVEVVEFDFKSEKKTIVSLSLFKEKNIDKKVEIIIIKTGFSHLRNDEQYFWSSPIIDSELPLHLKENFPSLKAVGFDVISVTSQLDREEGKKCHHGFLSKEKGEPILIIEDMDLRDVNGNSEIEFITILPLIFENMDGSPCTIMAKINQNGEQNEN